MGIHDQRDPYDAGAAPARYLVCSASMYLPTTLDLLPKVVGRNLMLMSTFTYRPQSYKAASELLALTKMLVEMDLGDGQMQLDA